MTPAAGPAPESARAVYGMLTGIALVAGFAIALAHELTAPRVARERAAAISEAVLAVLPGAATWRAFAVDGEGNLAPLEAGETGAAVYAGYDAAQRLVGFAVAAEGMGYQDRIRLVYGIDPVQRRLLGLQVLESRETPGLGARIVDDPAFLEPFRGLSLVLDAAWQPRSLVLASGERRPGEIDGITGATISSAAVARIVSDSILAWWPRLPAVTTDPGATHDG
jgi:electron transport complex protein RnfG